MLGCLRGLNRIMFETSFHLARNKSLIRLIKQRDTKTGQLLCFDHFFTIIHLIFFFLAISVDYYNELTSLIIFLLLLLFFSAEI